MVGLLLSRSADLLHSADHHGKTGLHIAATHGHYQMVEVLLGQGAEINATDKVTQIHVQYLLILFGKLSSLFSVKILNTLMTTNFLYLLIFRMAGLRFIVPLELVICLLFGFLLSPALRQSQRQIMDLQRFGLLHPKDTTMCWST